MLVDCFCMRQEDVYRLEQENMTGTLYNRETNSIPALRTFLRKAKDAPGLLPPWGTPAKVQEWTSVYLNHNDS